VNLFAALETALAESNQHPVRALLESDLHRASLADWVFREHVGSDGDPVTALLRSREPEHHRRSKPESSLGESVQVRWDPLWCSNTSF
jgi:hypothetical protein